MFVPHDPLTLMGLAQQDQDLVAIYIGKWIRGYATVTPEVLYRLPSTDKTKYYAVLVQQSGYGRHIELIFDDKYSDVFAAAARNTKIEVECKIASIAGTLLVVAECEVVTPNEQK